MRTLLHFVPCAALLFTACAKEDPVEAIQGGCGRDGARMSATFGTADWCASTSVIADGSGTAAIITGVSLTGGTLILQIDSLAPGQQAIGEAVNGVLFTAIDGSYTVPPEGHGTLDITSYDPTSGRVKGTADVGLRLNGEGLAKHLRAEFDVTIGAQ